VFKALGRYNGLDEIEVSTRYDNFLTEAKGQFKDVVLNKEILNRAKKHVEAEQKALLNPIKPDTDIGKLRSTFEAAMPGGGWSTYFAKVFKEEEDRLAASCSGDAGTFCETSQRSPITVSLQET